MSVKIFWSERDKNVKREDWYIVVIGTDGTDYMYDGTGESIDNSNFIEEIDENWLNWGLKCQQ